MVLCVKEKWSKTYDGFSLLFGASLDFSELHPVAVFDQAHVEDSWPWAV